ncbi:MAG: TlpA family protein disulfide reductase [Burkholderiales bacterium]|nr:TlpA family protein disulfide reductase [Burkholderiales bacterium]
MTTSLQRRLLVAIVAAVALGAGAYVALQRSATPKAAVAPAAVAALMNLSLPDASGKEQRLDQWRGKVVVVNFWATWCAPCREEMPEFIRAQKEYGDKGVQFIGIAVDQADKVQQYVAEIGLNYPALVAGMSAMELSKSLGNDLMALPFTVVLDRSGSVAHTQLGILKPDKLASLIKSLL